MLGHLWHDLASTCPHTKKGWLELGSTIGTAGLACFAWWIDQQRPDH